MSMGEPSFYSIHMMKDKGNSIFKDGNFSLAANLYRQALNFFCYLGYSSSPNQDASCTLALSLVLNLAICELKLSHYVQAGRYCSFVLHFDSCNVKALYRRGLANMKLNLLIEALEDFQHILRLDPNNSDPNRELIVVVDKIAVNPNGKRVAFPFDPLGSKQSFFDRVSLKYVKENQKYMYQDEKIMKWEASSVEEAYGDAKMLFLAKVHDETCDVGLPDPDIFSDKIDWDSIVDPLRLSDWDNKAVVKQDDFGGVIINILATLFNLI